MPRAPRRDICRSSKAAVRGPASIWCCDWRARSICRSADATHCALPLACPPPIAHAPFDTAVEQTTSELRLELMFPADAEADAFFRELAATATGQ